MSKEGVPKGAFPFLPLTALGQHFGEAADSTGNEPCVATGNVMAEHLPSVNICEIHGPLIHPWAGWGLYTLPIIWNEAQEILNRKPEKLGFL